MAKDETNETPVVSRVLKDGTIIELLFDELTDQTALAICAPDGALTQCSEFELAGGERLIPYSAKNNLIATGCVLLPSTIGEPLEKRELLERIRSFLRAYVELSDTFLDIATHYVLLTWVYDAFSELPYLRFRGDYGTGKTRALQVIGSICYKPFFASGASTVSPIFHVLDAFGGTLVLDEADFRFSDATAALTKILNNGNAAGLPVLRTMTNRHKEFDPRAFRVYGPKLIGMRERFDDRALESRFLTEETGLKALPPDVPLQLPAGWRSEALGLRNRLLAWRFSARHVVRLDASRTCDDVEPRLNQMALSLVSLVDEAASVSAIHERLRAEQNRLQADRQDTFEAAMIEALQEIFSQPGRRAGVAAVAAGFNDRVRDRLARPASARWVGEFLRSRLKLATVRSGGVFMVPLSERPKLDALAARFGVAVAPAQPTKHNVAISAKSTLVEDEAMREDKDTDARGPYQSDLFSP